MTTRKPLKQRILISTLVLATMLATAARGIADDSEPSPAERAFKAQILLNLQAAATVSPSSTAGEDWTSSPGWALPRKAPTVFVLVQITPSLLDTAVGYWAEGHPKASAERTKEVTARLRTKFIRENEKAFLLLVKPINVSDYHDLWAIKIGPIADNVRLVTLDRQAGEVTRCEETLDDMLDGTAGVKSCLLWVADKVDEESDPSFNIRLSNLYYWIKDVPGKPNWVRAESPESMFFRFETDEVHVVAMLEEGVPWPEIEKKYLQPALRVAESTSGDGVAAFLADVAVDLIVGLLLRGL